ncbi:hypothetical protein DFP72DRAFT_845665 [Ephemerocybe angulata]|uniref:Uncharacterized protein n=1 Tax=Ephemerocybe angulata TaxID=980116 RepID=A0A8H6M6L7_9AGAR|nr:hypothetical protein DFP72DRAFT_845665 [Tulosesus angulatus]
MSIPSQVPGSTTTLTDQVISLVITWSKSYLGFPGVCLDILSIQPGIQGCFPVSMLRLLLNVRFIMDKSEIKRSKSISFRRYDSPMACAGPGLECAICQAGVRVLGVPKHSAQTHLVQIYSKGIWCTVRGSVEVLFADSTWLMASHAQLRVFWVAAFVTGVPGRVRTRFANGLGAGVMQANGGNGLEASCRQSDGGWPELRVRRGLRRASEGEFRASVVGFDMANVNPSQADRASCVPLTSSAVVAPDRSRPSVWLGFGIILSRQNAGRRDCAHAGGGKVYRMMYVDNIYLLTARWGP